MVNEEHINIVKDSMHETYKKILERSQIAFMKTKGEMDEIEGSFEFIESEGTLSIISFSGVLFDHSSLDNKIPFHGIMEYTEAGKELFSEKLVIKSEEYIEEYQKSAIHNLGYDIQFERTEIKRTLLNIITNASEQTIGNAPTYYGVEPVYNSIDFLLQLVDCEYTHMLDNQGKKQKLYKKAKGN